jgi:tetratricopeptide (TPR) repeat protein
LVPPQKPSFRVRHWARLIAVATVAALVIAAIWVGITPHGRVDIDPAILATAARASPEVGALIREASDVAANLQEQFPEHPAVLDVTARLHARFGRAERAVEIWKHILELDPRSSAACRAIAATALEKGDLTEAETYFRKALELEPDSSSLPVQLGETLLNRGQVAEAIGVLEANRRRNPKTFATLALLGQAYVQAKEYAQARECLEAAIAIEPGFTSQYFSLGTACARLGDKPSADRYMKKFQDLKARDEQTHRQALRTSNDVAVARQSAAEIHVGAGQVRVSLGDVATGEQLLCRAAELCPADVEGRTVLAWLYARQGREQKAARVLDEVSRVAADQPTVLWRVGVIEQELRRFDKAEAAWRRAAELSPHQARPLTALVQLALGRNQNLAEAAVWAKKAVELEPIAGNYALLSVVCQRSGERAAAIAAAEQACHLEPGKADYQRLLVQTRGSR